MAKWEVEVTREIPEERTILEVEADTEEEAQRLAIEDAKKNEDLYFGPVEDPYFEIIDIHPMEDE